MKEHNVTNSKKRRWTKNDSELTLLCLPTIGWFFIFSYLPMFGVIIAFKKYKILPGKGFFYSLLHSSWCGLDNFRFFLTSSRFRILLRNTLLYNLVFIVMGIFIPVLLAILINELYSRMLSRTYQTMLFFPYFMSWVVASYFVYAFLNPDKGLINIILMKMGKEKIMWYSTPWPWPWILIFMQNWKSTGYNMVVYLAGITGIDPSLYESAQLDGACKVQQWRYITFPLLKPVMVTMFILNVGHIFYSDFGLFFQVTQRLPNSLRNAASTFDTYIYQALQSNVGIGRTAAAGLFQSICCCVLVLITNRIVKKIDCDNAII